MDNQNINININDDGEWNIKIGDKQNITANKTTIEQLVIHIQELLEPKNYVMRFYLVNNNTQLRVFIGNNESLKRFNKENKKLVCIHELRDSKTKLNSLNNLFRNDLNSIGIVLNPVKNYSGKLYNIVSELQYDEIIKIIKSLNIN
jgi:polyribonucleotide nucleotidyltransferase